MRSGLELDLDLGSGTAVRVATVDIGRLSASPALTQAPVKHDLDGSITRKTLAKICVKIRVLAGDDEHSAPHSLLDPDAGNRT